MKISLSNDDLLPFHGYRPLKKDGVGFERGSPESYSTIEHFYQSEKFRGTDEILRKFIISLPSAREARKAAHKHQEMVRCDWEMIRNKVMMNAIWFKLAEHDHYSQALLSNPDLANHAYKFKDHYWGDLREGVSVGFYRRLLLAYREKRRSGIMRVVVTGSPSFTNEQLLNAKLKSLFRKSQPDEMIINCDRGADTLAEKWAINNNVPVKHFPLKGCQGKADRARREKDVLSLATHVVIFWKGVSPRVTEFATATKARSMPLRIFKIDQEDNLIVPPKPRGVRAHGRA